MEEKERKALLSRKKDLIQEYHIAEGKLGKLLKSIVLSQRELTHHKITLARTKIEAIKKEIATIDKLLDPQNNEEKPTL